MHLQEPINHFGKKKKKEPVNHNALSAKNNSPNFILKTAVPHPEAGKG